MMEVLQALLGGGKSYPNSPAQGGLAQASAPPNPSAQSQQNTGSAIATNTMEENRALIEKGAKPATQIAVPFQQWLQENVREGLPSAQKIRDADMARYREQLMSAPERTGMEAAVLGMASALSNPEMLQNRNFASALSNAALNTEAFRQKFRNDETVNRKALLAESSAEEKRQMDLAEKVLGATTRAESKAKVPIGRNADGWPMYVQGTGIISIGPNGEIKQEKASDKMLTDPATKSKIYMHFFDARVNNGDPNAKTNAERDADEFLSKYSTGITAAPINTPSITGMPEKAQGNGKPSADLSGSAIDSWTDDEKAAVRGQIEAYKANPSPQTQARLEGTLSRLVAKYPGQTMDVQVTPGTAKPSEIPIKDKPKEQAQSTAMGEGEKAYSKQFDENVLKPAVASTEISRFVSDFNQLSGMQEAFRSGKFKEWAAGAGGAWLASILPEGSDLRKGVANAQSMDKIVKQLQNQILMAAKGVQTEGDAQRAVSQIPNLGNQQEANDFIVAFMKETDAQIKQRESMARAKFEKERTWVGFDEPWNKSAYMTELKGEPSVKRMTTSGGKPIYIGATQYMDKARSKGMTEQEAVASWKALPKE